MSQLDITRDGTDRGLSKRFENMSQVPSLSWTTTNVVTELQEAQEKKRRKKNFAFSIPTTLRRNQQDGFLHKSYTALLLQRDPIQLIILPYFAGFVFFRFGDQNKKLVKSLQNIQKTKMTQKLVKSLQNIQNSGNFQKIRNIKHQFSDGFSR